MKFKSRFALLCLAALTPVVLGGCAETRFLTSTAKHSGMTDKPKGHYKIGNPYQIQGVWYYPAEDFDYVETGIASWYGPKFHGKPTANGEVFDMNQVSAAHRTLQMPSVVRVTNLENGRSLVVRVNDRGPFAHGRIIDMSRRGAQLLGFEQQGTARVKVEVMREQSLAMKNAIVNQLDVADAPIKSGSVPKGEVSKQSLSGSQNTQTVMTQPVKPAVSSFTEPVQPKLNENLNRMPVSPTQIYVQAGAFSQFDNANRVKSSLSSIGTVNISQVLVNGRDFYRVRVGPMSSVSQADQVLENVIRSGYPSAKIIVENGKG